MQNVYTEEENRDCWATIGDVLQIIGKKYAFLIIGELHEGPLRFNQLRGRLGSISTQSLTDMLRHLEKNRIVHREVFPTVPVTVEYSLTELGRSFQTVLIEMRKWGVAWKRSCPDSKETE
ncbi:winged helix-turn-helix transcriptional regulator [Cohnella nanjingensis]|uniref:Helix-turn-helix transcriptional regulator n=1 Tax=Cohnella nanjingensis TaxID=1387779 RepID=A0A7X0RTN4_9BACL|nr:helix-turn-helix domain-containing protein [Cohnella nanjingensis]MBB6673311.1 helix-turn-helix transcriptional regulator [Cohnella nanjingensis]